jgi:hypothetical protein
VPCTVHVNGDLDSLLHHDDRRRHRGISRMSEAERLCQRGARGNAATRNSRNSIRGVKALHR